MKPLTYSSLLVIFCTIFNFTFVKSQDSYPSVSINGTIWMSQNLNVTHFRNGDPIPQVTSDKDWVKAGENKQPAWCYYSNGGSYGEQFGILYNWYAITDPRGLAPDGWRMPADEDFNALINYYQNDRKLLYAVLIKGGRSGMNVPLAGWRGRKGDFKDIGEYGTIWSVTQKGKWVSYLELNPGFMVAGMREAGREAGCYVRCIKVQ